MKEVTPNYYHKFSCIKDSCTHNCCIGWEIDIDKESMEFYNSLDTDIGERIRNCIDGDEPHFILEDNDRCPFLNEKGLCDIICELGEDALCRICTLHPRFKNFYSSFDETGLGLCCEEAARIILSQRDRFYIDCFNDITEEEKTFFEIRNRIFSLLQNRDLSIRERFSVLAEGIGVKFTFSLEKICDFYLSLERLDDGWTEEIIALREFSFDEKIFDDEDFKLPFEQLGCYFIFRHLGNALWSGDYRWGINFMLVSCYLIGAIWARYKGKDDDKDMEKLTDIARMYSAEIEYSEENTDLVALYQEIY